MDIFNRYGNNYFSEEFSYDDSTKNLYEYIFEEGYKRIDSIQKSIFEMIFESLPVADVLKKSLENNESLKLVFSDEVQNKLKNGKYHLMKLKDTDNVFKAVAVDSSGQIKELAAIKFENIPKGVDICNIINAMQGIAIKDELKEISCKLSDISDSLKDVIVGQHNDRIALYYAGEQMYKDALLINDIELKRRMLVSTLQLITESIYQLQINIRHEIDGVINQYDSNKKTFKSRASDIKDRMDIINSSFGVLHQAFSLKAAIFYYEGEYKAMASALMNYKTFLESTLTKDNTDVLYYADANEKYLDGIWDFRRNGLPDKIKKVNSLLANKEEYRLEFREEE